MPPISKILKAVGILGGLSATGLAGKAYVSSPYRGDNSVSKLDYYLTKIRLNNVAKRLATYDPGQADIPMSSGLHRVAVSDRKINENALKYLGFKPALIAVPENGQSQFTTYRHPISNLHIHRHRGYWTLHKDKYTPVSMLKYKRKVQNKPLTIKDLLSGVRHVITEGVPGEIDYLIGQLIDRPDFETILKNNPPRSPSFIPINVQNKGTVKAAVEQDKNKEREREREKDQQDNVNIKWDAARPYALGAAGLLGTSGLALKGQADILRLAKDMSAWRNAMIPHRDLQLSIPINQLTDDQLIAGLKDYNEHGAKVIRNKVWGLNLPYYVPMADAKIMQGYFELRKKLLTSRYLDKLPMPIRVSLKNDSIEGLNAAIAGQKGRQVHYKKFMKYVNPRVSLLGHIYHADALPVGYYDSGLFTPKIKSIFNNEAIPWAQKVKQMEALAATPAQAAALRNSMRSHLESVFLRHVGAPSMSAGRKALSMPGFPELYSSSIKPALRGIHAGLGRVKGPALVAGTLLAGLGALRALKADNSQQKTAADDEERDKFYDDLGDVAIAGGGTGLGAAGVRTLLRPTNIALTYGTMPQIGKGHSGPANIIASILQAHADKSKGLFNKIKFERIARMSKGEVPDKVSKRLYDMLVTTGLGVGSDLSQYGDESGLNKLWFGHLDPNYVNIGPKPNVATGGIVGINTDAWHGGPAGADMHATYAKMPRWRKLLSRIIPNEMLTWNDPSMLTQWGNITPENVHKYVPTVEILQRDGTIKKVLTSTLSENDRAELAYKKRTNPFLAPPSGTRLTQISKDVPPFLSDKALKALSEAGDRNSIISAVVSTPEHIIDAKSKQLLSGLGNKKLIVISGSSRGDYVAMRALDAAKKLDPRKYQIVAMVSGGSELSPAFQALNNTNVAVLKGAIPQELYVGLPAAANFHWASSGTSSLYEALASKVPIGLATGSNIMREREIAWILNPANKHLVDPWLKARGLTRQAVISNLRAVDLDRWNFANKILAYGDKARGIPSRHGVYRVQRAADLVRAMGGQHTAEGLAARSAHILSESVVAKANMARRLGQLVSRQRMLKNMKGLGLLGAGVAATSAGIIPIINRLRQDRQQQT